MIDLIKYTVLFVLVFIILELGPHHNMQLAHIIIASLAVLMLMFAEKDCNSESFSELPLKPAEQVVQESSVTSEPQLPLKSAEQVLQEASSSGNVEIGTTTIASENIAMSNGTTAMTSGNVEVPVETTTNQVTMTDVQNLIDKKLRQINNTYLDQPEYQTKDSDYYTNKGDLIDRSWENQYTLLDTKYWKPYISPPPLCIGRKEPCDSCPTINHMPYLELKDFDKSRRVFT